MSTHSIAGPQNGVQERTSPIQDEAEELYAIEESFNTPHCETRHEIPGVHEWAGDCMHEVVAKMIYCGGVGGVCTNTVIGFANMNKNVPCWDCGKRIQDCWRVFPV